jgi:hypothetical protein
VVDCGKSCPDPRGLTVHPELRQLCERHLGQTFYEVIDVY